ncbi:SIS domain-containing protein [Virgisporangium aurantiacum]
MDEIRSQPTTWRRAVEHLDTVADAVTAPGERVLAIGCGTSWFVAQCFAALRERAGYGETDAACAGQLTGGRRYDRVVAFTRSGTTTEIVDALVRQPAGTHRVAVVANAATPVGAVTDTQVVYPYADERSVVQTRFPTTVLAAVRAAFGADLTEVVGQAERALTMPLPVDPATVEQTVFLGSGWAVGIAHEAALKVREAAQSWAESYPATEFRHGPMAVPTHRSLVWQIGTAPDGMAETVAATGARLYVSGLDPLADLVLAQRFAVAMADQRGLDPDRPRLLHRAVILAPSC